jgi:hypothetical protein
MVYAFTEFITKYAKLLRLNVWHMPTLIWIYFNTVHIFDPDISIHLEIRLAGWTIFWDFPTWKSLRWGIGRGEREGGKGGGPNKTVFAICAEMLQTRITQNQIQYSTVQYFAEQFKIRISQNMVHKVNCLSDKGCMQNLA